jgi:prepilin-type N-terminal cleavage/methylation domain-containing protein/prepilin-type processing-associated H-X9-DG protein
MKHKGRLGFTLIELLVVIAIIAILAAILFPVFAKAREKARQITCASNLNQLGIAITSYCQDNNETFPGGNGWAGDIYQYVKSPGVYSCPDDTTGNGGELEQPTNSGGKIPLTPMYVCSYAMNSDANPVIGGGGIAMGGFSALASTVALCEVRNVLSPVASTLDYTIHQASTGIPLNVQASPTLDGYIPDNTAYNACTLNNANTTPVLATGNAGGRTPSTANGLLPCTVSPGPGASWLQVARHSGGSNYLAYDGHVKWLLPQNVSSGEQPITPTNANESISTCSQDYPDCLGTNLLGTVKWVNSAASVENMGMLGGTAVLTFATN